MAMNIRRRLWAVLAILACVGFTITVSAAAPSLKTPHIFGDNMVLQSGPATPVWGWAEGSAKITVAIGSQTQESVAAPNGKWTVTLKNLVETKEPQTMTVSDGNTTLTFKNILVGDVWLGSGQSNMEWSVGGVTDSQNEIAKSNCPSIRLFRVNTKFSGCARDDVEGQWMVCGPQSVPGFSAALYFFGREIHQKTGKPLGLLENCVGGTNIERWIAPEAFRATPGLQDWAKQVDDREAEFRAAISARMPALETWWAEVKTALAAGTPVPPCPWPDHPQNNATTLFNGMIHPVVPFGIRGAIWYQGESNGSEDQAYFDKTRALVEGWRKRWNRGDFPFYWVQLAGFLQPNTNPEGGDGWAKIRDSQRRALAIPNTGMASALDLFDANNPGDIHPKNKQDVGRRLALWALRDVYGMKDTVCSGPLFKELKIEGNKAVVRFESVGGGLMAGKKSGLEPTKELPGTPVKGFAIAGANKKWAWAEAKIVGDTIVLTSPEVPTPAAVRYAFSMNPVDANLYNKEGLPASPFRTDTW